MLLQCRKQTHHELDKRILHFTSTGVMEAADVGAVLHVDATVCFEQYTLTLW